MTTMAHYCFISSKPNVLLRTNLPLLLILCLSGVVIQPSEALHDWLAHPTLCESTHKPAASEATASHPMPALPKQYSSLVEINVQHDGWSYLVEVNVDEVNSQAAVTATFNGTRGHTIFDFYREQRYEISSDRSCVIKDGDTDLHSFIFVDRDKNIPSPPQGYPGDLISLPQKNEALYVGQAWVRGMPVDHWTACQEWKQDSAKAQIDYYFTQEDYETPWGKGQVPVRILFNGTSGTFQSPSLPRNHNFEYVYDFISFRVGKPDDPEGFQVPNDVVCQGGTVTQSMPDLPGQFEMDIELSSPLLGSSIPLQQSLRYDWSNQLVEIVRDFPIPQGTPGDLARHKDISHLSQDKVKDESDWIVVNRISWVEDYHTGLQYITVKSNNTCHVRSLPAASMSHGKTLLRMAEDQHGTTKKFTYQGLAMYRGLPAESWGMEADGLMQKVFFLVPDQGVEVPVSTKGMETDEEKLVEAGLKRLDLGPVPSFPILLGIVLRNKTSMDTAHLPTLLKQLVSAQVLHWDDGKLQYYNDLKVKDKSKIVMQKYLTWTRLQEMQTEHLGELDMKVYHYQPLHSAEDIFHVSQCYSSDQVTTVSLTVRTSYAANVKQNPTAFAISMRSAVAKAMGISAIQISELTPLDYKKGITVVNFNLLGSPPVKETNKKQMSLTDAKKNLVEAIKDGISFSVKYTSGTKSFIVDKKLYFMGDESIVQEVKDMGGADGTAKGYSGNVLAIAVTVTVAATGIVTMVAMHLYQKKPRKPSTPSVDYGRLRDEEEHS